MYGLATRGGAGGVVVYGFATRVDCIVVKGDGVYGLRTRVGAWDGAGPGVGVTVLCTCASAAVVLVSVHNRVRRWQVIKSWLSELGCR